VTFRLDAETLEKLEALESTIASVGVRGRRSILLRKLIHEEFDRQSDVGKGSKT
jgi:hypothetical protein